MKMAEVEGFRAQYKDYVIPMSDAPLVFHEFVALSIIGAALGNRVYYPFQDKKLYPNLWLCLVAPSSIFRKSTCLDFGVNILRMAKPEVLLAPSFSAESLWDILEERPQGIFVYSEFNELTGLLRRDYASGARPFLAKLYDCPLVPPTRKLRGREWTIVNPVVSMLSATTTNWWTTTRADLEGGFLCRWLFIPARTKRSPLAWPESADLKKQNALVKELQRFGKLRGEVVFTDAARKEYDKWLIKFEGTDFGSGGGDGSLLPFISRYETTALKLAIILEVASSGGVLVSETSIKEACNLINWITRELAILAGQEWAFSPWERDRNRVSKVVRLGGEAGISRGKLIEKTHIRSGYLNEIIENLIAGNEVKAKQEEREGPGPRKTLYFSQSNSCKEA